MAWHWQAKAQEDKADASQIEKVAVGLLARREHSAFELQRKLSQRGFDPRVIDDVISRLAEQGWQSDARYAEAYVRMRVERGYGRESIRAELGQRGVARALIQAVLDEADIDWLACAQRQIHRHYHAAPDGHDEKLRRYRHLLSRGFTPEQSRVASGQWRDAEGMDDAF
ncbi:regulatory protein RecX [Halothiobacillus sp.]|uniref:regulatory protein RecX n=1 Tax=Halothiobacillus sp. TaxID=1891311 RepID=UPI002628B2A5|nr:regulatory protein RecX [Halothiobacillus sp.]MDD3577181.1 regulatory protein RecX [Halothiobacillus sp.]MDD4967124.1 regulatory protein RecX [Halothiobacillus sp.]